MSEVFNVIVTWGLPEPKTRLKELNRYFSDRKRDSDGLMELGVDNRWFGGDKMPEVRVATGAFNGLGQEAFFEHIAAIDWEVAEQVQVMIRGQHDENGFHIFALGRLRGASGARAAYRVIEMCPHCMQLRYNESFDEKGNGPWVK